MSPWKVADHLSQDNLEITVADARFAKPIDTELLEKLWNEHQKLIIIEEGSAGGFSSHCLHFLSCNDLLNKHDREIKCLTIACAHDSFIFFIIIAIFSLINSRN